MAKTRHRRTRGRSTRRHKRVHRGGDLAGNPASSWGWGLGTAGNGWTQFMNSLTLQPGQNIAAAKSNDLVPVGRPNANEPLQSVKMNGGRRRRNKSKRSRRGGNWGVVLNQAAAPLALLGANQYFGKRRRSRKH